MDYNNYLATSPTGTATGFGASLMILDDLIKKSICYLFFICAKLVQILYNYNIKIRGLMMKKIISMLLAGLMILALTGCGSNNTDASNTDQQREEVPVKVKEEVKGELKEVQPKVVDRFILTAPQNTSAAVDELVLRAKNDAKNSTDAEIKEAVKFINDNYNSYWTDNETMHKVMYYGALLQYSNKSNDIKKLGMDAVQVVKYIYRKAETVED